MRRVADACARTMAMFAEEILSHESLACLVQDLADQHDSPLLHVMMLHQVARSTKAANPATPALDILKGLGYGPDPRLRQGFLALLSLPFAQKAAPPAY